MVDLYSLVLYVERTSLYDYRNEQIEQRKGVGNKDKERWKKEQKSIIASMGR